MASHSSWVFTRGDVMGARLTKRRKDNEVGGQADAAAAGVLEATAEAAKEVSNQAAEGVATATQEVSETCRPRPRQLWRPPKTW
ncbi:hypothetical protein GJAV_G00234480 [Gymnothorax javanicus]|nr:hypothetical protein GJAV_G00234480 [Gymnothorax javanicus]